MKKALTIILSIIVVVILGYLYWPKPEFTTLYDTSNHINTDAKLTLEQDNEKNDIKIQYHFYDETETHIDYFMNDESESVRFTICKHYPERIPQLITKSADDYNNAFLVLVDSMDEKLLELVVKHYDEKDIERNSPFAYESYKIVYESMVREPTAIEKTMTRTQLFLSGNPLWAQGMTQRKANMLRAYYESSKDDNKEKDFLKHFDKMSSPETSIWGMKDIYFNL